MCMSMASPTAAVTQVHYSLWDLTPLDPPLFCVLCWPVHCFTDPLPPLWYCCKSPIFEPCQCFACWPGSRAAHVKYVAGTSHGRRPADSIGTGAGESRSEQAEACCTSALLSPCTLWVLSAGQTCCAALWCLSLLRICNALGQRQLLSHCVVTMRDLWEATHRVQGFCPGLAHMLSATSYQLNPKADAAEHADCT